MQILSRNRQATCDKILVNVLAILMVVDAMESCGTHYIQVFLNDEIYS